MQSAHNFRDQEIGCHCPCVELRASVADRPRELRRSAAECLTWARQISDLRVRASSPEIAQKRNSMNSTSGTRLYVYAPIKRQLVKSFARNMNCRENYHTASSHF